MNNLLNATSQTLQQSSDLLRKLNNDQLSDSSVAPYHSCVGSHIRHILDFYQCVFDGLESGDIDLTARRRDLRVHCDCDHAMAYVERIQNGLKQLQQLDLSTMVSVRDDHGSGVDVVPYTLGGLLAQANSHAIHHYAIINYILNGLKVQLEDSDFGYNPTTPKPGVSLN